MATLTITSEPKNDWIKEGGILFPCNGKITVTDNIPAGIWKIVQSPAPMDSRLGLVHLSDSFDLGLGKVYDVGGEEIMEVIKKTWADSNFAATKKNLCVIFQGLRGTGKTITSKILCNYYAKNYPVLILDSSFGGGAVSFIQNLDFECVVLIDEAEKTFAEDRTGLLKIADGVYSKSPKLVLMTMNTLSIDENMIDRPGRVRYIKKFGNLSEKTCREVIADHIQDPQVQEQIFNLVSALSITTIDILKTVIDEYKICGNLGLIRKYMNIPLTESSWEVLALPNAGSKEDYEKLRPMFKLIKSITRNRFYDWWHGFNRFATTFAVKNGWWDEYFRHLAEEEVIDESKDPSLKGLGDYIHNSDRDEDATQYAADIEDDEEDGEEDDFNTDRSDSSYLSQVWGAKVLNVDSESTEVIPGTFLDGIGTVLTPVDPASGLFWARFETSSDTSLRGYRCNLDLETGDEYLCYLVEKVSSMKRYGNWK